MNLGMHKVADYTKNSVYVGLPPSVVFQDIPEDKPSLVDDQIYFEFSDDLLVRQKYFDIREQCYRETLGLGEHFPSGYDPHDMAGHVLVVRKGNKVIGGARIIPSTPEERVKLALEDDDFNLLDALPEFHLENKRYCEFSRLAMLPGYPVRSFITNIVRVLSNKTLQLGYQYVFAVAPIVQARLYGGIYRSLGLDYEIRDIPMPQKDIYGGRKMYLSISDTTKNKYI